MKKAITFDRQHDKWIGGVSSIPKVIRPELLLCQNGVRHLFDVPASAKRIKITISDKNQKEKGWRTAHHDGYNLRIGRKEVFTTISQDQAIKQALNCGSMPRKFWMKVEVVK